MSATNLGRALRTLNARVTTGTKLRIRGGQRGDIGAAIVASVEESLRRLGRDSVDILHLHEPITRDGAPRAFTADAILRDAVAVLQRLRDAPEIGHALRQGEFSTARMPYNILNPSGLAPLPAGSTMPDLGGCIRDAAAGDVG